MWDDFCPEPVVLLEHMSIKHETNDVLGVRRLRSCCKNEWEKHKNPKTPYIRKRMFRTLTFTQNFRLRHLIGRKNSTHTSVNECKRTILDFLFKRGSYKCNDF